MEYLEGGATYSGASGWAAVATLSAVGAGIAKFASGLLALIKPFVIRMLAGGPLGWIAAAISVMAPAALMYLRGQFLSAGSQAAWYMARKGKFNLKLNNNPFSLFSVS